ncbi:MAG TPA: lipoate--protein ligase family protein [Candidatus Omnitrophota bacterium]|nr:lipoate--protein ligase family protein [Candidatus Omnitrophota bacterium]
MWARDISFEDPQKNILFDEVLYHLAETDQAGEAIRFWESPVYFIVLGRIGKINEDVQREAVGKDRIPVLRRASGGGTVLQGKGCLNYTLILSKESRKDIRDLKKSYQYILGHIVEALKSTGVEADYFPVSDIALKRNRKKISGNAQKRGRHFIMHHGTVLLDFDLPLIEKYLTMPEDIPEYRQKRGHLDFVSNTGISSRQFKDALKASFGVTQEKKNMSALEEKYLNEFLSAKESLVKV